MQQPIAQWPSPQTTPFTDYQFLSGKEGEKNITYLIYAAQRDFLSVPNTHIVIIYYNQSNKPVEITQWQRSDYLKKSLLDDFTRNSGFFENNDTPPEQKEMIFLLENKLFQIKSTHYNKLITYYHELDSITAFKRFLSEKKLSFTQESNHDER